MNVKPICAEVNVRSHYNCSISNSVKSRDTKSISCFLLSQCPNQVSSIVNPIFMHASSVSHYVIFGRTICLPSPDTGIHLENSTLLNFVYRLIRILIVHDGERLWRRRMSIYWSFFVGHTLWRRGECRALYMPVSAIIKSLNAHGNIVWNTITVTLA